MTIDNSVLRSEIDLLRHGVGDAASLMGSLRRSVLFLPCAGEVPAEPADTPRAVRSGDEGGIRWIYAFTKWLP